MIRHPSHDRCLPLIVAALLCTACGDDGGGPGGADAGVADLAAADLAADGPLVDAAGAADVAAADQSQPVDAFPTKSVTVTYQGNGTTVRLGDTTAVLIDDTEHARVADVIALALPDKAIGTLAADFVAGDGFRPGNIVDCAALVPLGGDELDRGYLDWYSRKLRWDDALGYPPCMRVKDVAEILVSDL